MSICYLNSYRKNSSYWIWYVAVPLDVKTRQIAWQYDFTECFQFLLFFQKQSKITVLQISLPFGEKTLAKNEKKTL